MNNHFNESELCDLSPVPTGNSSGLRKMNPQNMRKRAVRLFWGKVKKAKSDSCWPWKGRLIGKGYGIASYCGHAVLAHRLSFYLKNGFLPKDLCVCHRCDNPRCVNPQHLFLGTIAENNFDMKMKNRQAAGSKNGMAKLSEKEVKRVRDLAVSEKISQREIAEMFGVSQGQVSHIKTGVAWSSLQNG